MFPASPTTSMPHLGVGETRPRAHVVSKQSILQYDNTRAHVRDLGLAEIVHTCVVVKFGIILRNLNSKVPAHGPALRHALVTHIPRCFAIAPPKDTMADTPSSYVTKRHVGPLSSTTNGRRSSTRRAQDRLSSSVDKRLRRDAMVHRLALEFGVGTAACTCLAQLPSW